MNLKLRLKKYSDYIKMGYGEIVAFSLCDYDVFANIGSQNWNHILIY